MQIDSDSQKSDFVMAQLFKVQTVYKKTKTST